MQLFDAHIHMNDTGGPVSEMLRLKHSMYDSAGFNGVCLVCDTSSGDHAIPKNSLAFLYKYLYEGTYVFTGIDYFVPGETLTKDTVRLQAEKALDAGADGFKMYEGKPSARRMIGNRSLLDSIYDDFFSLLEERQTPLALHLGDPAYFWYPTCNDDQVFANHWFYGNSAYPALETIHNEIRTVLESHPKLQVIIPQIGYMCDNLQYATRWLDDYPQLKYDLGPTPEYYGAVSRDPNGLAAFLTLYADRILFACLGVVHNHSEAVEKSRKAVGALMSLGLSEEVKRKILATNFEILAGSPKALDVNKCTEYASSILKRLAVCCSHEPYGAARARIEECIEMWSERKQYL